ncbi:hypothetical protein [Glutamicibacter mysorens]|uniref:hypothetical protein n=1 Tax=Glutamicibacter mysorens TaxID=257984 RepID=UPI0020C645A2|nr:hypothetical protein [Glutamicibacter mysorens]UTM47080.1 hypothetical protein XH9_16325 [Glutamicibacter mysorens]
MRTVDPQALAELVKISEQARGEYQAALNAYDAANALSNSGAALIADQIVAGKTPDPDWVSRYEKYRNSTDFARSIMIQKYDEYSLISDQLLEAMQKPSAGATAEGGETNNQR